MQCSPYLKYPINRMTHLVLELDLAGQNIEGFTDSSLLMQDTQELQVRSLSEEGPWRRKWQPTAVFLPGKSHGRRSLVGFSPWGRWESDTIKRLHFHFLLSCIGEGSGKPLQCSCLENPRDGGDWWAAVSGVAQSWTQLKRFSSSSCEHLGSIDFVWKRYRRNIF